MNPIDINQLTHEELKELLYSAIDFVSTCTKGSCAGVTKKGQLIATINEFIADNPDASLIALMSKAKRIAFNVSDISRVDIDSSEKSHARKGLKIENKHVSIALIASIKSTFNLQYYIDAFGKMVWDLDHPPEKNTTALAGIWKGYIVRSEDLKISEVIILLGNDGKCHYLSSKMGNQPSIGQFKRYSETILHGSFVQEGTYNFHYVLRITRDDRLLVGTLSGFGVTTGFKPAGGIIFFNKEEAWQGNEHTMLEMFKFKASKLVSYSLSKENDVKKMLADKPYMLNYFFGESNSVKNNILIESVSMWQDAYLIPKFDLNAQALAGDYIIYRLGTSRKKLVKRVIRIHETGHLEMKLKRTGYGEETYYGRLHFFDGHICIAIDRRRTASESEVINRTMYLFNAQNITNRQNIDRLFGLSVIVNGERMIRAGEDILIKAGDNAYDGNMSAVIWHEEIVGDEKVIYDYLKKSEVITVGNKSPSNTTKTLTREAEMGITYFESACFAAINGHSVRCVEQLIKAIDYGFNDKSMFDLQWNKHLSSCKPAIELKIDVKNLTLKS
jgi:hypothetical protein